MRDSLPPLSRAAFLSMTIAAVPGKAGKGLGPSEQTLSTGNDPALTYVGCGSKWTHGKFPLIASFPPAMLTFVARAGGFEALCSS